MSAWLEVTGADVAGQLAEKRRLFDAHRADVLQALPGSEDACSEVLDAVRAAGVPLTPAPGRHPLEVIGRAVPEDFCVHLPAPDGQLLLVAAAVCFPNKWRLADKLGRPVADIHGPVPLYAPQIGSPVDRIMERLAPDRLLVRANWGLHDGSALFDPMAKAQRPALDGDPGQSRWLRVERQTLRRLPRTGAVVFTIRTLHGPLDALRADSEAAALLATAMRQLPAELADYKLGGAQARDVVLRWLDDLAASPG
jgi:hypothetical protein